MGCTSEQEEDCYESEKPDHQVILSDYYIAETEVTQSQWKAIMGYNPSDFKNCDDCPVEQVGWNDVQKFIYRLNDRSVTLRFRLPTEAEWEYAARGGNMSKGYIYAGSNNLDEAGWYADEGSKTHPVKGKIANELGIFDMSGNVWEWCSDLFGDYSTKQQSDPQGAVSGVHRVNRGGNWYSTALNCRASRRSSRVPDDRVNYLGFRLAAYPR
jgi:formylglycine-generating enzyme required for sulfatase activity